MIRFEYDVPTSGVRVSFVLRGEALIDPSVGGFEGLADAGDTKAAPETIYNLKRVRKLLNAVIKRRGA